MPGEQLLLINPRRKRRKNPRRHKARHRRRNPVRAHRIRRRRVKNPRAHRRRHRNPRMRHYRRRHRNPSMSNVVSEVLIPAGIGAAGGAAIDYVFPLVSPYFPSFLTSSTTILAGTKVAMAFGLGLAGRKFLGPSKGNALLAGAVTVQLYNFIATLMGGTPGMAGLGAYMNKPMSGLGSPNPAVYLQKPMGRMGRVGAYINKSTMNGLPFAGLGSATMDDNFASDGM